MEWMVDPVAGRPIHASQISHFLTCELQWKLGLDNIHQLDLKPPSTACQAGTIVHEVLHQCGINGTSIGWKETHEDTCADINASVEAHDLSWDILDDSVHTIQFPISAEYEKYWHVGDFAGTIDRLQPTDTGLDIIDYKTGEEEKSKEQLWHNPQAILYMWAMKTLHPQLDISFELWYLRSGSKVRIEYNEAQMDRAMGWILSVKKRMDAISDGKEPSHTIGPHCLSCPFSEGQCKYFPSDDCTATGRAAMRQYHSAMAAYHEQQRKLIDSEIKVLLENETIYEPGWDVRMITARRRVWPSATELAKDIGTDIALSISGPKADRIDALIKERPELKDAIESHCVHQPYSYILASRKDSQ